MRGLMKMHPTDIVVLIDKKSYLVPKRNKALHMVQKLLSPYEVEKSEGSLPAEEVFSNIVKEYGKAGALIRGYRYRENMSQVKLAQLIGVTQGDLSKMESGKKPIGKMIAKRLAKVLKTDYRNFL